MARPSRPGGRPVCVMSPVMDFSTVAAGALGAVVVAAVSPYLARLTVSAPDRGDKAWWRAGQPASTPRSLVVAAVGLVCGGLAGASAGRIAGLGFAGLGFAWLAMIVTPLVVIDIEHRRLPDRLVLAGLLGGAASLGAATLASGETAALVRASIAAAVVFATFCVLTVTTGFGFGDTKLVAVLAGYLGWLGWDYVLCGVIGGFCVGTLMSLALLITGRVRLRTAVPFGPALVAGALLVSAFGLVPAALA
jgi:leader peptidase (prepilin peptidase) / N-methyltransferase